MSTKSLFETIRNWFSSRLSRMGSGDMVSDSEIRGRLEQAQRDVMNEYNLMRNAQIDAMHMALTPSGLIASQPTIEAYRRPIRIERRYVEQNNFGYGETMNPHLLRRKKECILFIARQTLYDFPVETIIGHIKEACKAKKINLEREYTFKTQPTLDTFKVKVIVRQFVRAPKWTTGDNLIRQWILQQAHRGVTIMSMTPNRPEYLYPGEEQ